LFAVFFALAPIQVFEAEVSAYIDFGTFVVSILNQYEFVVHFREVIVSLIIFHIKIKTL